MGSRHQILQGWWGEQGRTGQRKDDIEGNFIFEGDTWIFGMLSRGMALAVASECLLPALLHPHIPWLGSDTHSMGV